MHEKKQLITIKGTRDGLTLFIDDDSSFSDVVTELKEKLQTISHNEEEPVVSVKVQLGNRYLNQQNRQVLKDVIEDEDHFKVDSIESNIIHREDALRWKDESEIKVENGIVRSGQVLKATGDILLVGDVNPGGTIMSTGNIYIMGNLYGIAHAGCEGDKEAFIAASYMKPTQLRIADYISRAPDYESDGVYMECCLVDEKEEKIVMDSIKLLYQKRNQISRFERRIQNG